jgi:outer membrane lipoprotein-sorting protein
MTVLYVLFQFKLTDQIWGIMKRFILLLCLSLFLISGCAMTPKAPLVYKDGAVVETLSANAVFSIAKDGQTMSASGLMVYKRPGQMRLIILSPFGTTVMELFVSGDHITIIDTSNGVAFSGLFKDLPAGGEADKWRQARWIMEIDTPDLKRKNSSIERINSSGIRELVKYADGVVVSKKLADGKEASYDEYIVINGVPLATEIVMESPIGDRFSLKISDPEVNGEIAADAFEPKMNELTVYPLSALKGS